MNNDPLLLNTFYLKTGSGDQKQKAKIVFCVCHGPEKGSKYLLETVQTTFSEISNYYQMIITGKYMRETIFSMAENVSC